MCAVKDVYVRRIVGWSIGYRMTAGLADAALRIEIARRRSSGTRILHSNRGGQFRARRYRRTLSAHGLQGSMGRVTSAGDKAEMESFFSPLKNNVLNRQPWNDRDQLRSVIIVWVESSYSHRRGQRALGKLTPEEHEALIGCIIPAAQHAHTNQPSTKIRADPSTQEKSSQKRALSPAWQKMSGFFRRFNN